MFVAFACILLIISKPGNYPQVHLQVDKQTEACSHGGAGGTLLCSKTNTCNFMHESQMLYAEWKKAHSRLHTAGSHSQDTLKERLQGQKRDHCLLGAEGVGGGEEWTFGGWWNRCSNSNGYKTTYVCQNLENYTLKRILLPYIHFNHDKKDGASRLNLHRCSLSTNSLNVNTVVVK